MADQLYLSLWYPNFRLESLPAALEKVMEQFAAAGGSSRVSGATVYPISWNETPVWQRVYRNEADDEGVTVVGFGPEFDDRAYETNGQIRVDFGLDTPFLYEDMDLDEDAVVRVKQNVEKLVQFTNGVQKNGGISTRLLWSESGESLAKKLIERLQQVN